MRLFNLFPLIISFLILSMPALADDDTLPPPSKVHDTEDARETVDVDDQGPNLREDLTADENVDIRSYTRDNGELIEEHSINGKVYMVRVQPGGGFPAYYLYDDDGDGTFNRRLPGGYKRVSPPMWVIKRF
ncbi:MAG: DUF2782 domain-containing protein [Mariprofundaceae bacterium]